jgi:hypothetical protein
MILKEKFRHGKASLQIYKLKYLAKERLIQRFSVRRRRAWSGAESGVSTESGAESERRVSEAECNTTYIYYIYRI